MQVFYEVPIYQKHHPLSDGSGKKKLKKWSGTARAASVYAVSNVDLTCPTQPSKSYLLNPRLRWKAFSGK